MKNDIVDLGSITLQLISFDNPPALLKPNTASSAGCAIAAGTVPAWRTQDDDDDDDDDDDSQVEDDSFHVVLGWHRPTVVTKGWYAIACSHRIRQPAVGRRVCPRFAFGCSWLR